MIDNKIMIDNKPKYLKADFDALGDLVMEMYAPKQPQEVIEEAYKPDDFVTYQGSDHYVVEIDGNMAYIQDVNNDGGPFEVSISELEGEQAEGANPEQHIDVLLKLCHIHDGVPLVILIIIAKNIK